MSQSIARVDAVTGLVLQRGSDGEGLTLPSQGDLFLLRTRVAGTHHHDAQAALPSLALGVRLRLLREPANPHDDLAIAVQTVEGLRLGYVPRSENPVLARLMDGGKLLFARVVTVAEDPAWPEIGVDVWMREF